MEQKGRLPALDSMRAIAALGVVCWHYRGYFQSSPFETVLAPFYKNGLPMVDFFFALSGFVLARTYWTDSRRRAIGANIGQRIARLYPLHLIMLLVILAIQLGTSNLAIPFDPFRFNDAYNFGANLLLLQSSGLQHGLFSFNQPSWSISTEFLVNIAFLCMIALPRRLSLITAGAAAVACIQVFLHRSFYDIGYAWWHVSVLVARTGAGFFIGALTFRLYENYRDRFTQAALWNALFIAFAMAMYVYFHSHRLNGRGIDLAISLIGFPASIIVVLMSPWACRALSIRTLVWLGERSYSIYMIHFSLILCARIGQIILGVEPSRPFASDSAFVAFVSIVIAISAVTYRYIELPGKRLLTPKRSAQNSSPNLDEATA
ncbi:MAG TPA: acyltransferase [Dyella sp.]|uniref:acyltransferase family protein n=1 Tax=Dyella sp. TaxID=1869338 RepID=UPI002D09B49E|nr:acyltransferase [Dyella sp.]HTV85649.1 acyltransferase [Dyella sp.]